MRRVLDGGVGCESGGMAERSIESGDLDERREEIGELVADMVVTGEMRSLRNVCEDGEIEE